MLLLFSSWFVGVCVCMFEYNRFYLKKQQSDAMMFAEYRARGVRVRKFASAKIPNCIFFTKMPALNGMAPSSLDQLMKSLINAPKSVFQDIDQGLLEKVRNPLTTTPNDISPRARDPQKKINRLQRICWKLRTVHLHRTKYL